MTTSASSQRPRRMSACAAEPDRNAPKLVSNPARCASAAPSMATSTASAGRPAIISAIDWYATASARRCGATGSLTACSQCVDARLEVARHRLEHAEDPERHRSGVRVVVGDSCDRAPATTARLGRSRGTSGSPGQPRVRRTRPGRPRRRGAPPPSRRTRRSPAMSPEGPEEATEHARSPRRAPAGGSPRAIARVRQLHGALVVARWRWRGRRPATAAGSAEVRVRGWRGGPTARRAVRGGPDTSLAPRTRRSRPRRRARRTRRPRRRRDRGGTRAHRRRRWRSSANRGSASSSVGDGSVQPSPFRRKGSGVRDLADERVTHPVGIGRRVDNEQVGVDGGTDGRFDLGLVELDDPAQELRIGVPADGRQRDQHMLRRSVEPGDVGLEEIRQQRRDRLAGAMSRDELLGEERVALPTPQELVDQRRRRRDPEHARRPAPRSRCGPDLPGGHVRRPRPGTAPQPGGARPDPWPPRRCGTCRPARPARRPGSGRGTRRRPR